MRFERVVLEHVERHLAEDVRLEQLSDVAGRSPSHLHRAFRKAFGINVGRYVRALRLRRAAYRLAYRGPERILEIALACGYDSHEAFGRAFKRATGQTPSQFRARPRWDLWARFEKSLSQLRGRHMAQRYSVDDVQIVDREPEAVAVLEHRGDPRTLGETIRTFIAWRKEHRLPPRVSATYNRLYGGPETTAPEAFRLDLCAATTLPIAPNPQGVVAGTLAGGRHATLTHVGSDDTLGAALGFVFAQWLPQSGERPRDDPPFLRRVRFFPDVPEAEAVTEIFVPLQ